MLCSCRQPINTGTPIMPLFGVNSETGIVGMCSTLSIICSNVRTKGIKTHHFKEFQLTCLNYSTRKPTATFRHRRSRPRHLASSTSWQKSVHPNVLSLRPRRSPPGAPQNSTKNCHANSFQNKCEKNFARKARSVEVLKQPSNRKRDSITNHPPPSPNP